MMKRYESLLLAQSVLIAILLIVVINHKLIHRGACLVSHEIFDEWLDLSSSADIYSSFNDYNFIALGNDYKEFDICYKPLLNNLCDCAYEHLPLWEASKWCHN